MNKTLASIILIIGTMVWGAAFVAQNASGNYLGPFALNGFKFTLGSLVLIPLFINSKKKRIEKSSTKDYIVAGLVCGLALFAASYFQQIGVMNTTVGKSGFVTALYVVLVPFLCLVIYRRKMAITSIVAAILASIGIYNLCVNESFTINLGDFYNFIGAIFWAIQILAVEKFASKLNGIKFALYEFGFSAIINFIFMFVLEDINLLSIKNAIIPVLYLGILSAGFGFTAQIVCQKYLDATVAAIIMSLESVFSVIFGFLFLHELLTVKQIFGCVLVFISVILAQIDPKLFKNMRNNH